jgi:hypothetical protein
MAYYPKNKILTNQVISSKPLPDGNGNVYYYILPNGDIYEGFGYKLANGLMYTGKFPNDGKNILLTKYITSENHQDPYQPTNTPFNSTTPVTTPPLYPTPDDYKFGSFIRYFSKKRNEYLFEEITKDQYNALNTPSNPDFNLYKPFYIKWMLTGNPQTVSDFNYWSIRQVEEGEQVYGLNEFLNMNYTPYYK